MNRNVFISLNRAVLVSGVILLIPTLMMISNSYTERAIPVILFGITMIIIGVANLRLSNFLTSEK